MLVAHPYQTPLDICTKYLKNIFTQDFEGVARKLYKQGYLAMQGIPTDRGREGGQHKGGGFPARGIPGQGRGVWGVDTARRSGQKKSCRSAEGASAPGSHQQAAQAAALQRRSDAGGKRRSGRNAASFYLRTSFLLRCRLPAFSRAIGLSGASRASISREAAEIPA